MTVSTVRIGLVFPELLGTYGDRGNALMLQHRLVRRGLRAEVLDLSAREPIPDSLDCYVVGGGEDHAELTAAPLLRASPLRGAWERGACIVAICAGYQLLGESMELTDGSTLLGMDIIEAHTRPGAIRHVGNVVVEPHHAAPTGTLGPLGGFENHRGVTTLAPRHEPLGTIAPTRRGDVPRDEGLLGDRLVGTYLHGPVLAGNPALADHVLHWIVGDLATIEPSDEDALHAEWIARVSRRRQFTRRAR